MRVVGIEPTPSDWKSGMLPLDTKPAYFSVWVTTFSIKLGSPTGVSAPFHHITPDDTGIVIVKELDLGFPTVISRIRSYRLMSHRKFGAGERNRTFISGLEIRRFTTKLHPHKRWWTQKRLVAATFTFLAPELVFRFLFSQRNSNETTTLVMKEDFYGSAAGIWTLI